MKNGRRKNRLFRFDLYREAMRRLSLIGILFTVVTAVIPSIYIVMNGLNTLSMMDNNPQMKERWTPYHYNYMDMSPLIVLSFCCLAPLLTLSLFSFLNKREDSDYFHALPVTRYCLYFSFVSAVITWLVINAAITACLVTLSFAMFPQLYIINLTNVLLAAFCCLAASLQVSASIILAKTVTGTLFNNILLSGLILFFPRYFLGMVSLAVKYACPMLNPDSFILFNTSYHIPVSFVIGMLTTSLSTISDVLTNPLAGIYSLILAVLFLLIGAFLFHRRSSECATHSAPNPLLQSVYRIFIGFSISMIATINVFTTINGRSGDHLDWPSMVILNLIALVAILIYESICRRSIHGIFRKCFRSILGLAAANLFLFIALTVSVTLLNSYSPSAEQITAVQFYPMNDRSSTPRTEYDYLEQATVSVSLEDPSIRELVARQFAYTKKAMDNPYTPFPYETHLRFLVRVKSGFFWHERIIWFPKDSINEIALAYKKHPEVQKHYLELPERYEYINCRFEDNDDKAYLYRKLRDEVSAMPFENWYNFLTTYPNTNREISFDTISICYTKGANFHFLSIPLEPSILPKTCNYYIELENQEREQANKQITILENGKDLEDIHVYYDITLYEPLEDGSYETSGAIEVLETSHAEEVKEFTSFLNSIFVQKQVDVATPFFKIEVYMENKDNSYRSIIYYPLKDATIPGFLMDKMQRNVTIEKEKWLN